MQITNLTIERKTVRSNQIGGNNNNDLSELTKVKGPSKQPIPSSSPQDRFASSINFNAKSAVTAAGGRILRKSGGPLASMDQPYPPTERLLKQVRGFQEEENNKENNHLLNESRHSETQPSRISESFPSQILEPNLAKELSNLS